MKPTTLNFVCAHPVGVSWLIGALTLNVFVFAVLMAEVSSSVPHFGSGIIFPSVVLFCSTTLLGYFLGMFTCWPWVRALCSKFNGASLKIGDEVHILSGPDRNEVAKVYEKTIGQGGWTLVRLDLGSERKTSCTDIFEQYSVLNITRANSKSAVS